MQKHSERDHVPAPREAKHSENETGCPSYDAQWGDGDDQFVTREIELVNDHAILHIDVHDEKHPEHIYQLPFHTYFHFISDDHNTIEFHNNGGHNIIHVDATGSGSLQFIGAELKKGEDGQKEVWIVCSQNYVS